MKAQGLSHSYVIAWVFYWLFGFVLGAGFGLLLQHVFVMGIVNVLIAGAGFWVLSSEMKT